MGAQNFNSSPGFNDVNSIGFGPVPSPSLAGIDTGSGRIGGGAGGHAAIQAGDVRISAVDTLPEPPRIDAWERAASAAPVSLSSESLRSDLSDPQSYEPTRAPQETNE